jgi:hypothetical protein
MQLEKVTSGSGHAALAGWISSNDVTLFTTVLIMAIAIFLHSQFSKVTKQNAQFSQQQTALGQQVESVNKELANSRDLLDITHSKLALTQQEQAHLEQQLVEKLTAMDELNARLDALLQQKGALESRQQVLVASQDALSNEKTELIAQRTKLADERDSLKTKNLSLREQLELISAQLAGKITALENVDQERDRLKKQAEELDALVTSLRNQLDKLNTDFAETQSKDAAAIAQDQRAIQDLQSQIAARDKTLAEREKTADEYVAKLKRAADLLQGLVTEKKQLQHALNKSQHALSEAELKHQEELVEEGRNNQELVGLTGRLERVAILFDASGSMRQAAAKEGGNRWAEAQQIAETWLQHLNVHKCVLIVFSTDVRTFPEDGSLANLGGPAGKANRDSLLQRVKTVQPGGGTNTYDALRTAYRYDIDSILLFSDGAPSVESSGKFDASTAERIYQLCRTHPDIPIHTMGLGNYFDQSASTFLMTLAKLTNGSFRGR